MSDRVTMPALGESVTEGTVTRWLKNIGDSVEVDEPLLEVSTDKVDTEIPSPVAGTLQEILAQEDETVPVGADLAVIGEGAASGESGGSEGGAAAESSAAAPSSQPAGSDDASAPEPEQPEPEAPSTEQPMAPQTSEPEADQAQGGDGQQQSSGGQQQSSGGQQPSGGGSGSGGSAGQTVTMPALGESVTEGTVTRWLKSEGDTVELDEPLLEVSTDKVDTEIPSPAAGVVSKILVQEDEVVPVGGDLAVIGGGGGEAGGGDQAAAAEAPAQPSAEQEAPSADQQTSAAQAPAQPSAEPGAAKPSSEQEAPAQATAEQGTQAASQAASSGDGAGGGAGPTTAPAAATASAPEAAAPATATAPASSTATRGSDDGGTDESTAYVTPLVRKLAAQHSVDLASLTGTGIGGRIRKQDVLDAADKAKAAAAQPEAPAPAAPSPPSAPAASGTPSAPAAASPKRGTTEKMSRLRKVIAQRMVESLQVSAQLTTVVEVDLTKVARLRARAKSEFERREGVKLSYLPFLALAAVEALKAHPNVNASVEGDEIIYHGQENLSIAVDTEKGLIVPVVKNAGDLNIAGLARAIADLADRTRSNKITPDDLAGGTFTITNTGSRGALFDTPIINQPQVAILGTGALVKRPVVVTDADGGETIAVRSMMYLALSYDHRIVDGADAARFLGAMKTRLEEGRFEASLGL
ncbi:MAG TPA: 2-oxoglutarate dehydrogenase, E2 component, dihydrolipoamide succinyltransferase [Lapillicoccus sp.]|nr:2-oxoglutarate dehydrogenase, E2 component, dihydrolipoamide succinyltransferase [Lapillicoccus sp.]